MATTTILISMSDSVQIPTTNPGFSTVTSLVKVSASDCDNNGQPEIARLVSKRLNFISICRSLWKLLGHSFIDLTVVKNLRFGVGISIPSVVVPTISVFLVSMAIWPFSVVHCRNHLSLSCPWSWIAGRKTDHKFDVAVLILTDIDIGLEVKKFSVLTHVTIQYRSKIISFILAITCEQHPVLCGWKPWICLWLWIWLFIVRKILAFQVECHYISVTFIGRLLLSLWWSKTWLLLLELQ